MKWNKIKRRTCWEKYNEYWFKVFLDSFVYEKSCKMLLRSMLSIELTTCWSLFIRSGTSCPIELAGINRKPAMIDCRSKEQFKTIIFKAKTNLQLKKTLPLTKVCTAQQPGVDAAFEPRVRELKSVKCLNEWKNPPTNEMFHAQPKKTLDWGPTPKRNEIKKLCRNWNYFEKAKVLRPVKFFREKNSTVHFFHPLIFFTIFVFFIWLVSEWNYFALCT